MTKDQEKCDMCKNNYDLFSNMILTCVTQNYYHIETLWDDHLSYEN